MKIVAYTIQDDLGNFLRIKVKKNDGIEEAIETLCKIEDFLEQFDIVSVKPPNVTENIETKSKQKIVPTTWLTMQERKEIIRDKLPEVFTKDNFTDYLVSKFHYTKNDATSMWNIAIKTLSTKGKIRHEGPRHYRYIKDIQPEEDTERHLTIGAGDKIQEVE